jgi:acyl carrier protein
MVNTSSTPSPTALDIVCQQLSKHTETPVRSMQLETKLADIDIDSLALGELLFALEDKLEVELIETTSLPETIGDLVVLIQPYLGSHKLT